MNKKETLCTGCSKDGYCEQSWTGDVKKCNHYSDEPINVGYCVDDAYYRP
jgi:hypothetical protein